MTFDHTALDEARDRLGRDLVALAQADRPQQTDWPVWAGGEHADPDRLRAGIDFQTAGPWPREDTPVKTCPIQVEALGINLGECGLATSHRVVLTCDADHKREVVMCEGHAEILRKENPLAVCLQCDQAGAESQVRPLSIEPIGASA